MEHPRETADQNSVLAVVGHVGVGHVHSHSGYVQDDSAGFVVVAELLRAEIPAETRVKSVRGNADGRIVVETAGGGRGESFALRGLTPFEIELLGRAVGEDAVYSQRLAVKTFGRMYGQGAMEPPVALQGAAALAALDTFHKTAPQRVQVTTEAYPGLIDKMAAAQIALGGRKIALLLTINGSAGGVGPCEDNEGNTAYGAKGELMRSFGIDKLPTVIVESKAYIPARAQEILQPTYFCRAQKDVDNTKLARALERAAKELNLPVLFDEGALPRAEDQLGAATRKFADNLIALGERLRDADDTREKVALAAELAKQISEDAGGVTFMSNRIHEEVRSAGIVPGSAAVLSMLVPKRYADEVKIPLLNEKECANYRAIVERAIAIYFDNQQAKPVRGA